MNDNPDLELCLNLMTKRQRRRWRKRLSGMSLKEIADDEGVTYQAVQDSLNRGLEVIHKDRYGLLKILFRNG
jgi:predicted DNA-binding protein YlxM (UPF0122 family)